LFHGEKEVLGYNYSNAFLPFLKLEGYEMILTFIRSAYEGFDEINIHADGLINGQK
jgi:hypothetical protein